MKRITYCLVCGATPSADATSCHQCGAPLRRKHRFRLPAMRRPSWLSILTAIAALALIAAAVTWVVTR